MIIKKFHKREMNMLISYLVINLHLKKNNLFLFFFFTLTYKLIECRVSILDFLCKKRKLSKKKFF